MKLLEIIDIDKICKDESNLEKEILSHFKNRCNSAFIGKDKDKLIEYVRENNKKEVEEIIKKADRFMAGRIIFDMKWDMERCNKEYIFKDEIDWTVNPFGDEEWIYMLNRHKHILLYAQAYLITNDEKYSDRIKKEIKHWIINVKPTKESKAFRTIEVGIRLRNWIKVIEIIINSDKFDYEFLEMILISIKEQIDFILQNKREDRILSNWVVMEHVGVFIAASFFKELKNSSKYIDISQEMIRRSLDIQILNDGLHWEQSYMYHNEIVNCIMDMVIVGKRSNVEIDSSILYKMKKALNATLNISDPNMMQINYGDSDYEDLRDILCLGSILLKEKELKYNINEIPIETIFEFGYEGIDIFNKLEANDKKLKSKAFTDAGNYIIRDTSDEKDIFTFFKCGPLGSGHGHYDLLHVGINYKGEEVLSDSGRYSYREDEKLRNILKGSKSHNTLTVDNKEFNESYGSWGSKKIANYIKREHKFSNLGSFVEGAHTGYKDILLNRKVIYINSGIWILSDEFFAKDTHNFESRFNFNKPNLRVENNRFVYYMECGKKVYLESLDNLNLKIENTAISPEYNSIYESQRCIFEKYKEGDCFFNIIIHNSDAKVKDLKYIPILDWKKRELDSKYAKAIKILCDDKEYIVIVVTNEEPTGRKTYIVDNTVVYGRVIIIKRSGGLEEIDILSY